jgi:N,N'-diacetyllegionaminate synthase
MLTIRDALKVRVGYSDHTPGMEIPLAAVALGACVIEKHFTLDRSMEGPDHKASLEPDELKAMIRSVRNIERAFGDGIKKPTLSEIRNKSIVRKSIVASTTINAGEILNEKNITVKRPGDGISPMLWDMVLGRRAPRDFHEDELIEI